MAISQPSYPIETQALVSHVGTYADTKAPTDNPTFTGTVTVPTAAGGDSSTKAASTAFVTLTAITTKTANHTLALADNGTVVRMNLGTALVLTVPLNSVVAFPIGSSVGIMRYGAGSVTITPAGGVTIPNAVQPAGTSSRTITSQMTTVFLLKVDTNEWVLEGGLT